MQETIPEPERSPGGRNGNPLQHSCLGNPTVSIGSQGFRNDWSDWACPLLPFIPPPASQSSWASSWEMPPRSPDGKIQRQGLWKSLECLFRGAFAYWLVWRVTLLLLACASFPNLMLFQPVDLLGLSEGLKPTLTVLHVNQSQEVPTRAGFIRDGRPFSWEKDRDHPEIQASWFGIPKLPCSNPALISINPQISCYLVKLSEVSK